MSAKSDLEAGCSHAEAARVAILARNRGIAGAAASQAVQSSIAARSSTSPPLRVLAASLPFVGSTVQATRQIAEAVDDLAFGMVTPAAQGATVRDPVSLRPRWRHGRRRCPADRGGRAGPSCWSRQQPKNVG